MPPSSLPSPQRGEGARGERRDWPFRQSLTLLCLLVLGGCGDSVPHLALGETVVGNLAPAEAAAGGDRYRFSGRAGQVITATVISDDLAPQLALRQGEQTLATGQPIIRRLEPGERLTLVLPHSGTYTLVLTSSGSGDYRLSLAPGRPWAIIRPGRRVTGLLAEGDYQMRGGSYADEWRFDGSAGRPTTISLSSSDFDALLLLVGPDGNLLARNDNSRQGLDAELEVTLPLDGIYSVWATSADPGHTGLYTLRVR